MQIKENFSRITLGPQKPKCFGEIPENRCKYFWILLANDYIQAIIETNVCAEFEENRP